MRYRQITSDERYILARLRLQGVKIRQIANILGRHRSTIYRELKRNCSPHDGFYRALEAKHKANARRWRSRRNTHLSSEDIEIIELLTREDWSPEQVSGFLKLEKVLSVSHETIYRHIWKDRSIGGTLFQHLRQGRKRRRKGYGKPTWRGRLPGKRPISERPASVENRRRVGHWEIDTVIGAGRKHCVVSLVERKSGLVLIGKLESRTNELLNSRVIGLIRRDNGRFYTITADNGSEFHGYEAIEQATGVKFYFATPYRSWERATNENTNGLIRQYLPKGKSMKDVTQRQCNAIADRLNRRPRKRLGFRTPMEVYHAAA